MKKMYAAMSMALLMSSAIYADAVKLVNNTDKGLMFRVYAYVNRKHRNKDWNVSKGSEQAATYEGNLLRVEVYDGSNKLHTAQGSINVITVSGSQGAYTFSKS